MEEFPEKYDKGDLTKVKRIIRKTPVNWELVNSALQAGCRGTEIAAKLNICPKTLYLACKITHGKNWFDYSFEQREQGALLLRMKMFQLAMGGDKTMLIFLGKTRLGLVEKQSIEVTTIPTIDWATPAINAHVEEIEESVNLQSYNLLPQIEQDTINI